MLICRTAQFADHIIKELMMCVNHPVADIINDGLEIAEALDFRIIKDDNNMWFIYVDKEWRRQKLDENNGTYFEQPFLI